MKRDTLIVNTIYAIGIIVTMAFLLGLAEAMAQVIEYLF